MCTVHHVIACTMLLQNHTKGPDYSVIVIPFCTGGKLVSQGFSIAHHAHTGHDASASSLPPLYDLLPGPFILFPLPEHACSQQPLC